ncbi:hypothetical protein GCM10029963_46450 [Micromonospora andamanensis]|uniref:DUF397 domain-containing protein n=1 Tax=Micromonospora andamanensis TaxID=1287068 RepID=UPI00194E5681|nr:DUF397 domain-containing protein [Micromonospora andamanensis]GIJ38837.1 hypothetical protein Vwe01_21620 [Micromonospora andamanensis]
MVHDLTGATWRKSTRSGSSECVEVADNLSGVVGVRDSKDATGPVLTFAPTAWRRFVDRTKLG